MGIEVIITVMIGDIVRQLREERHWTQSELARRAGLTSQQISQMEAGKRENPTQKTVKRLADAFEMGVVELLALSGNTEDLIGAELLAAGRSDSEIETLIRIWPQLSAPLRSALLRAATEYVIAVEQFVAQADADQPSSDGES